MGIISWIIVGGIAGWLASIVVGSNARMGLVANIVAGIIGAFIGGFIMNSLGYGSYTGLNFWSIFVAFVGAVVLLLIIRLISGRRA
ncbi:MAG: GlsB/YeaQ/YmgE family stress response membrane protein [Saccharofermentanales bacterium]